MPHETILSISCRPSILVLPQTENPPSHLLKLTHSYSTLSQALEPSKHTSIPSQALCNVPHKTTINNDLYPSSYLPLLRPPKKSRKNSPLTLSSKTLRTTPRMTSPNPSVSGKTIINYASTSLSDLRARNSSGSPRFPGQHRDETHAPPVAFSVVDDCY